MTTADVVTDRALALARAGTGSEEAIQDLLECCGDKRVSVVMARQHVQERLNDAPDEPSAGRALELLEEVLLCLPEV